MLLSLKLKYKHLLVRITVLKNLKLFGECIIVHSPEKKKLSSIELNK